MERFVIIVNGWNSLTIITKHSILDVAAALNPPLEITLKNSNWGQWGRWLLTGKVSVTTVWLLFYHWHSNKGSFAHAVCHLSLYSSHHVLIKSQQWKHHNNVWKSMFKVNRKYNRMQSDVVISSRKVSMDWKLNLRIQRKFGVNLRIQSKYRKIRTRKNSVFGHFSRSVWCLCC